jgi:hypothetical protein
MNVAVGEGVGVEVCVGVGVLVGVRVAVGDEVGVLVGVGEDVGAGLTVRVGVSVGVTGWCLRGVDVGVDVVMVRVGATVTGGVRKAKGRGNCVGLRTELAR